MKLTKAILIAAAAIFASSASIADPVSFKKADANADGSVDATEFAKSGIEDMEMGELDENGDGALDKDEYSAALDEDCS